MSKLKPILDRVVIKEDQNKGSKLGKITIPPSSKKQYATGTIIEVGGEVLEAKKGSHCAFNPDMATVVAVDEEMYVVCREREIIAIYQ